MRSPAVTSWHGTTGLGSCPDRRHRTGSTFDLSAIFDFQMKSKRQNHSAISDLSLGWSALENQTGRKNSAHETIWRLHGGPLRDSETPPPLLRRVAAEVFRLASISRPLMRPRRGVGVSPPGIISRRRRIHPVDRNNNKQFSGPPTTQPARPVRPYCFGAQKDPRGRGEPAGLWPCRPALAVPAMARKLRPALACAPPRRSRRLPHTARLAEGRTEPDFEPAEPNDRAVVVVGRCSCRTRPQCARTAAFRRAARMCRSNVSRCASRPSPETPCLSVEARRY